MLLRSELRRILSRNESASWTEHLCWLKDFYRWRKRTLGSEVAENTVTGDTTVMLNSFRRPQNIDFLARIYLRLPSIRKVIVSNNNSRIRIRDWVQVSDPRLVLIDQPVDRMCVFRVELARRGNSRYFIFNDDDIFLTPQQIGQILSMLRADPGRLHGVQGEIFDPAQNCLIHDIRRRKTEVDIINRLYFLTAEHIREFFRLTDLLKLGPDNPADDMLLSFSGTDRPLVHDAGPFMDCPTNDMPGIALWRQEGFFDYRVRLFHRLSGLKSFPAV
jgi:hypothetical protein